jgi:crossover junction endodeoxyribonuclease RusA
MTTELDAYRDRVLVDLFVPGKPAPQGSKRGMPIYRGKKGEKTFTGKVAMVEMAKGVAPWREDIRQALLTLYGGRAVVTGPVSARLEFVLYRPTSLPKGRPTPPAVKQPDLDKLTRAVFDAVTSAGCVWHDDSQVVREINSKRLAEIGEAVGCHILIEVL